MGRGQPSDFHPNANTTRSKSENTCNRRSQRMCWRRTDVAHISKNTSWAALRGFYLWSKTRKLGTSGNCNTCQNQWQMQNICETGPCWLGLRSSVWICPKTSTGINRISRNFLRRQSSTVHNLKCDVQKYRCMWLGSTSKYSHSLQSLDTWMCPYRWHQWLEWPLLNDYHGYGSTSVSASPGWPHNDCPRTPGPEQKKIGKTNINFVSIHTTKQLPWKFLKHTFPYITSEQNWNEREWACSSGSKIHHYVCWNDLQARTASIEDTQRSGLSTWRLSTVRSKGDVTPRTCRPLQTNMNKVHAKKTNQSTNSE